MRQHISPLVIIAAVAALLAGAAQIQSARANAAAAAATRAAAPTPIAVVRLAELLDGLEERAELEARLNTEIEQRQTELNELAQKVVDARESLQEAIPPGTEAYRNKAAEIYELEAQARIRREILQQRILIQKGAMLVELYAKIGESAKAIAEREGYDAVFIDDSKLELPPQPTEQAALGAILSRRLLYTNDSIDITADLRTLMNNRFNAGNRP